MWWQTLRERLLGWSCLKLCMRHLLASSSLKLSLPSSRDTLICSSISSRSAILPTPILICVELWMKSNSFVSITLLMLVSWVDTPPKTLNTSLISTTRSKTSTGLTRFMKAPKLVAIGSSGLHSSLPFLLLHHPLPGRHATGPVCLHRHRVNLPWPWGNESSQ